MDTPIFDLAVNGDAPDQYATEAGLEARINAGFSSIVSQANAQFAKADADEILRGRHGWVEDVADQYGANRWVVTRREAFNGQVIYETGRKYIVRAANTNTGPVMVSISNQGGKTEPDRPLLDADGNELEAGEIVGGRYYEIRCGADVTRNYRLTFTPLPEKERIDVIETTGLLQLFNVAGRNAITAELDPDVRKVSAARTGMLYALVAPATTSSRTVTLKIGDDGAALPVRAPDGSPLRVGDLKADRLYILRRYGPAATDAHYRVAIGVDPVFASSGGGLPDPLDQVQLAIPGDYPDLQAAFDAAVWIRARSIEIQIANGHLLTKGLRADGASAAHIRITYSGTGAVKLAPGFVGASNTDADPQLLSAVYRTSNNVFVFNRGEAPTIGCLIDMEGRAGNGYAGVNCGSQIEPGCGVINAGVDGFVQQGGKVFALYSKWDGAGGEGIRCQQASSPSFQGATADNCQSSPTIRVLTSQAAAYFSRGSNSQFQDGSVKNSGGHGLGAHRCFVSATNFDGSGAAFRGIEGSHGAYIVANGADLGGAGEYAFAAGGGGGVTVNLNGANLKGAGIKSIYLTEGGNEVKIWGTMTNSTPGTWVRGNTYTPVISDVANYDDATHPISFNLPGYRGVIYANVPSPMDALRGGATGQVPVKKSAADFDYEWQTLSGGGGGGVPTSRMITGTGDLTGGGDLTSNRTLDLTPEAKAKLALAVAAADGAATASALAGKEPLHGFVSWSTAARDLAITDNRARLRATHATPVLTIRHAADVVYVANTLVEGSSLNAMLIQGSTGVTVNGTSGGSVLIPGQTDFRIERVGANDWVVTGKGATLGTAAALDAGTAAGNLLRVGEDGKLPEIDGSKLTGLPSAGVPTSRTITGTGDLAGGGDLSSNRTLDLTPEAKAKLALAVASADGAATASALAGKEPLHGLVAWSAGARDLVASDNLKRIRATHAAPVLTIRPQTDQAYVDNTLVTGASLNQMSIVAAASVALNGVAGGSAIVPARTDFTLQRIGVNDWVVSSGGVTAATLVELLEAGAADTVDKGPRIGAAVAAALETLTKVALLGMFDALSGRIERRFLLDAIAGSLATGDLLLAGPVVDGSPNLRSVGGVPPEDIPSDPNRLPHFDEEGFVEPLTYEAVAALLEDAGPFDGKAQPVTLSGGVLSYHPSSVRIAKLALGANCTFAATLWDGLTGNKKAWLLITVDGTARTITAASPEKGLRVFGATSQPVNLAAGGCYLVEFGEFDEMPYYKVSQPGFQAADATVEIVSYDKTVLATAAGTLAFTDKPLIKPGDKIYAITINPNGGTPPDHPSDFTVIPGITNTSNAPSISVASKVALVEDEALSGWVAASSGARVILVVARKAGGSPATTVAYWKATTTPGGADTVSWPAASIPQRGVFLAIHALVAGDLGEMRSGIVLKQTFGSANRVMLGLSDPTATGLAAETTDKTNNSGRSATLTLGIY